MAAAIFLQANETTMTDTPLVSIITPTHAPRHHTLSLVADCVFRQDWPHLEWLIDDDGEAPSPFMQSLERHPAVHYRHSTAPRSIGAKRNAMIARARGAYIVHFDDDDYYAPHYVRTMLSQAMDRKADLVKLYGFYLYHTRLNLLGYWDQMVKVGLHYVWSPSGDYIIDVTETNNEHLLQFYRGFGFSFVYKRQLGLQFPFEDVSFNEDGKFFDAVAKAHNIALIQDFKGLCIHFIHNRNSSTSYPQFLIPPFVTARIFPEAGAFFAGLGLPYGDDWKP